MNDLDTISIVISTASALIAAIAVFLSVRYAARSAELALHANIEPILADQFREFRSEEFRNHLRTILAMPPGDPSQGFSGLDDKTRNSAYSVCYYFEYIGHAVAFGHCPERLIIGTISTQLVQVWEVMEPWIQGERRLRQRSGSSTVSPAFLPFYENLVARIIAAGGAQASAKIRQELGLRQVPSTSFRIEHLPPSPSPD